MTHLTNTEAAIVAAAQASEATTELLRYVREGAYGTTTAFSEAEPVMKLAEALKLAIEIDTGSDTVTTDDQALRDNVHGVLTDFIEGWAG